MIVLHGPKLIFVRTRKTAGTSVEIALSRHAGPDDIITSLSPRDEALRLKYGGRPPQNHLRPGCAPGPSPVPPGPGPDVRWYNHMPAAEIREQLGGVWDEYLTVCLERSPYEKTVSLYYHRHRTEPRPPISEFIDSGEYRDAVNWPLYTDGAGRVLVNVIVRHEDLRGQLAAVCARAGLPPVNLPHAKSQFRPAGTHYRDVLTPAARRAVEAAFAAEFEHHPYTW
ncbi:hypothetical protein [Streptomyces celluloflavus]|uniref:hypothetical protein n=1 Tax=Streptomyces celluloflavus TaxID=58344 RepID=UPI0036A7012B